MKILTSSAIIILSALVSFSQNVIYKKDNTKIEAKILEINQVEVRYKIFANPDGPLYIMYKGTSNFSF